MSEDRILPREPKYPMNEVLIRSSPGGRQTPPSKILILSESIPHGYHSNQLCMGAEYRSNGGCEAMEKSVTCIGCTSSITYDY